eukprot:GEMP01012273.1.p1 GENE.GEMP01012273.1~~GEMP01012273.1.p1  ORF type:complete len:841 (+),score=238.85 GEMP01012273.1:28-2550(+)
MEADDVEEKDAAYDAIEKEVKQTILDIKGDRSLDSFRDEYEKLAEALKKSHDNEERLIKKCRELNTEIQQSTSKVQTALKLSQEDQATIESLKQTIDRNWHMVDASQEKEAANKATIAKLKNEIQILTTKLDQGSSESKKQDMEVLQLVQQRDALMKECDIARSTLDQMKHVENEAHKKYTKMEKELEKAVTGIETIKSKLEEKRAEQELEHKRKDALEVELKELRIEVDQLNEKNRQAKKRVAAEQESLKQLEDQIRTMEAHTHEQEVNYRRLVEDKKTLESKVDQETSRKKRVLGENAERAKTLEAKTTELKRAKAEMDKLQRLIDALKKRTQATEEKRKALEGQRADLKLVIKDEAEDAKIRKKDMDSDKKKIEDLLRERDILNKNVIQADLRTRKEIDLVTRQTSLQTNLQKDVHRWKLDAVEYKKAIFALEKQREKYGIELSVANSKHFASLEDLKKRETRLTELKKETGEVQSKLNQQKNLYDTVCTERNLYSKNLIESNEEISQMKKKFKIMYHQIEQLKEEIKEKDSVLIKEHFEHHKVAKSNDSISEQIEKAKKKVKNMTNIVDTQQQEVKKIESTILEAETEKSNQQNELDGVIGERDILTTQLIRRNEELAVLYEKIKIQRSSITKGQVCYKDLLAEIGGYEASISKLRKEFNLARGQIANIQDLRKEIFALEKQLLQEESRKQALVQELSNPLNVHRWRKVEGSDPQTFELLNKVKQLQKRLIQKSEEVVEKDALIEDKEKLYVQLKNILARQPGPEVSEQLGWYTDNLKEKTQQMQKMSVDLQDYHAQVRIMKADVEHYQNDLRKLKNQYFDTRTAEEADAFEMQEG